VYQDWVSLVNDSAHAVGAGAVLNTAATATISPTTGAGLDVASLPAAKDPGGWEQGTLIRWTARGYLTTTATSTTATFLLAARVGNTGSTYVTLATSLGLTTGATAYTGIQWTLRGMSRCTNVATSGNTIATQAEMWIGGNPATAPAIGTAAGTVMWLPSASGETNAAIDTTQLQGLSMRATLAGANATIQLTQWACEMMN
jgi:hypothetical protein